MRVKHLNNSLCLPTISVLLCCLVFSSCSTWKNNSWEDNRKIGDKGSISTETDLVLDDTELPPVSLTSALASYQRILKNASHPEARQKILRRIADLSMMATEEQLINELDEKVQIPLKMNEKLTLENSIKLYNNLLLKLPKEAFGPSSQNIDQAEIYYHLAKLYDMTGQPKRSLDSLNTLVSRFPNTAFHVEAQFRRGENLFLSQNFSASAKAYEQAVLGRKHDSRFYEQSLYKSGWSHYKRNDYISSLHPFFSLLDELENSQEKSRSRQKMRSDTYRAVSLAFSHLDGEKSISLFFKSFGQRDYEPKVYEALAMHFLQQERYSDTASVLEHFVNTHPLHPYAPGFQTDAINALAAGGFPSLVLPAKENFVRRFGIRSEFWQHYHRENPVPGQVKAIKDLRTTLKSHLQDLSTHYHSLALNKGEMKSYESAIHWYRLLLETFPYNPNAHLINQLIAEILLDTKRYQEAIIQFEHTAKHPHSTKESAANNRYAALLAYQSLLKQKNNNNNQIKNENISAALRFYQLHPEDKRTPAVLNSSMNSQFQLGDTNAALNTATLITQLLPSNTNKMIIQNAWIILGNSYIQSGKYKKAEQAIDAALRYPMKDADQAAQLQEQRVSAIYKQAEQLQELGYFNDAISLFNKISRILPDSLIRPQADFAAAVAYLESKQWKSAITQFNAFRKRYPNHKLNNTLSEKLALAYEQTKNWPHVAVEMEIVANQHHQTDPELARIALWQAATFREKAKQVRQAIRVYKRYAWTYPLPLDAHAQAQYRLSTLYQQSNDLYRSTFWRRKLVQDYFSYQDQNTAQTRYLAAKSAYQMAQPHHQEFEKIKLKQPLQKSIAEKQEAMQQALKYYGYVLEIGEAQFISAALYQTGSLYQTLAADLISSQRPKGLNESELEQYEILLEEQAFPFENRAIENHKKNTELVRQNIYDQWVKKSYQRLRLLLPLRYAKDEKFETIIHAPY